MEKTNQSLGERLRNATQDRQETELHKEHDKKNAQLALMKQTLGSFFNNVSERIKHDAESALKDVHAKTNPQMRKEYVLHDYEITDSTKFLGLKSITKLSLSSIPEIRNIDKATKELDVLATLKFFETRGSGSYVFSNAAISVDFSKPYKPIKRIAHR